MHSINNQDRMTDHRIGQSFTGIASVLEGAKLEMGIEVLRQDFSDRRLESLLKGDDDIDE